eukprot:scaffold25588_cov46-Isochrysis_galbana.AAC.1
MAKRSLPGAKMDGFKPPSHLPNSFLSVAFFPILLQAPPHPPHLPNSFLSVALFPILSHVLALTIPIA